MTRARLALGSSHTRSSPGRRQGSDTAVVEESEQLPLARHVSVTRCIVFMLGLPACLYCTHELVCAHTHMRQVVGHPEHVLKQAEADFKMLGEALEVRTT